MSSNPPTPTVITRDIEFTFDRESGARTRSINLGGMRKSYLKKDDYFSEDQLVGKEPFATFDEWFAIATKTPQIEEPNAMCLATATKDGRPSARMVLLKGYGEEGFKFFTNYQSRKGLELAENPYAALNFYWEPLKKVVRIEGKVEKLGVEESTEYFQSRPFSSQIGASISSQSQPIPDRNYLAEKEKNLTEKFSAEKVLPKPEFWGGFLLIPDSIEFWQGQTNRIHDRIRFRKLKPDEEINPSTTHIGEKGWVYERLSP